MGKMNFKNNNQELQTKLQEMRAYDLAVLYRKQKVEVKKRMLSLLDDIQTKNLFIELYFEEQRDLLSFLNSAEQKKLLNHLESDDLKEFIIELPNDEREVIFNLLPKVRGKAIRLLLEYDEDLAASIMTNEFITIEVDASIKEATNKLVTSSQEQDYIETLFIVDNKKRLLGVVDLKDLIIARANVKLAEIMNDDFHFVYDNDTIEKAIQTVQEYDRNVIPVLNHDDQIIGIITAEDVFDEMVADHDFHYQKMALLNDHEMDSTAFRRVSQRLPWLMIDVVLSLVLAVILSIFEATFIQVAALVLFQPLILGMAGNIGTQSLAVTILGLHIGDVSSHKISKTHVMKEALVGLINSFILAVSAFVFVTIFLSLVPTGTQSPVSIAIVVFLAIFGSMFVSAIIGAVLPIIFKKMNIDPAAASGPIMTTINDVVALVLYFGIATLAFVI